MCPSYGCALVLISKLFLGLVILERYDTKVAFYSVQVQSKNQAVAALMGKARLGFHILSQIKLTIYNVVMKMTTATTNYYPAE